jgi:hypothetical protein
MVAGVACVAGAGLLGTGCAIHTQSPIKEIAYDFSDRDFYDRAYAPSPKYLETEDSYTAALAQAASSPTQLTISDADVVRLQGLAQSAGVLRPGASAAEPTSEAPAKAAVRAPRMTVSAAK